MAYILILILTAAGSNGGNSVAMAEFDGKPSCEAAGKSFVEATGNSGYTYPKYICAPKSVERRS